MTINTVIFDLDGTLLYTLDDLTDSVNQVLNNFSYPQKTTEEIKNSIGNGVELLIERVIPDGKQNENFDKCVKEFKLIYSKNMNNKTKVYDGVIDLLTNLKAQGFKTAVVSNKFDRAVKDLCKKHFNGLIDCACGQKDGAQPKPQPDLVFEVIKILGAKSEECIFVGDSEVDIQTAQNADIPSISVTWGYKSIDFLYKHGAEVLVYSPSEISELI